MINRICSLLRNFLGLWLTSFLVRRRIVPPKLMQSDFESRNRYRQFCALASIPPTALTRAWPLSQVVSLLHSPYPTVRRLALRRLFENEAAFRLAETAIASAIRAERQRNDQAPVLVYEFGSAEKSAFAPGYTMVALLFEAEPLHRNDTSSVLTRKVLERLFEREDVLEDIPTEKAVQALPGILEYLSGSAFQSGDPLSADGTVRKLTVQYATALIRAVAKDLTKREFLAAQRDELVLRVFQHPKHPNIALIDLLIDRLTASAESSA